VPPCRIGDIGKAFSVKTVEVEPIVVTQ